jgi:acyl carrier protein
MTQSIQVESPVQLQGPAQLRPWLRERIAFYLDQPADTIDPDVPLAEYGMNSIYAVSVAADIEDHLGIEFKTIPTWSHPTVNLIAAHVETMLAQD